MEDEKFGDLFSGLVPGGLSQLLGGEEADSEQQSGIISLLDSLAGQVGGGFQDEIDNFINGRGSLLEITRGASTRGGSAASEVAGFLTDKFNLSKPLATLVAPLVLKLFPSVAGLADASPAKEKPRPRRPRKETTSSKPKKPKAKPKTEASSSAKPKKPKPKPASASSEKPKKPKPKPAASASKPKRPKTSTSGKPKKPAGKKTRSEEIAAGPEE